MNKYLLHPEECLLMLIDVQERLCAAMEEDVLKTLLKNSLILLKAAKVFGMPVMVSEQYPKGLGRTVEEVAPHIEGLRRYEKLSFSCYRDPAIQAEVDSLARKTVIVAGIETHVCVFQTVIDLLMAGHKVVVADDAVCSRRAHDRMRALTEMRDAGAVVYSTEMIAFMLLERAGTPEFKELSPLFK